MNIVAWDDPVLGTWEVLACTDIDSDTLTAFIREEIVRPYGRGPGDWAFSLAMVMRVRQARRLQRDLELGAHAVALALQLMDEIGDLRAQVRRLELLAPQDVSDV
ncbi:MAG: chaperone modulator CbpM [Acidiferrobacteraceae bacterium]